VFERPVTPPTGTVTFAFTDIEGSTRLLQELGKDYVEAQDVHAAILRDAIALGEGVEIRTEGDSFFAVFTSPAGAIAAAVDAQRGLRAHRWPQNAEIRVRIGIHTGEGVLGGDDYVGIDVNRAARIAACGHGGQVLVSEATATLVAGRLPGGVHLEALGAYRLKDLPEPERIHQLAIDSLPGTFPPLRALDARRSHLPADATTFVGRQRELDVIEELLGARRLVTLTGPGGIGKTRLALRAAADVAGRFRDGAFFIALATVDAAAEVPTAIATAIGIPERAGTPVMETLRGWLRDRELLLVLDNLEQIDGVASLVAALLEEGDGLRVLATSRAPLRISGEQEFSVPAFPAPADADGPGTEMPEAVELFLDRARLIRPDFAPSSQELSVVGDIATRLEGVPLSIELAAARVRTLPVASIRDRLERRLDTLVGGAATLPDRQRTLREAIAWSDDLLDTRWKVVFHRLAAFVRGCTLGAAEHVVGDDVEDVARTLDLLAEQSLLQASASGAEARFTMLETIREFASERLEASGETAMMQERHAAYFLEMARAAEAGMRGPEGIGWLDRLDADLDNLRAAITRADARGDIRTALSIAAGLERFWLQRNRSAEGREILESLVDRADPSVGSEYARATSAATSMEVWLGNYAAGRSFGERSVAAYRELGDAAGLVEPLGSFGFAMIEVDPQRALEIIDESLDLAREVGDVRAMASTPLARAVALFRLGRFPDARSSLVDAVTLTEQTGDRYFTMMSRYALARTELLMGDTEEAMRDYRRALEESRAADLGIGVAVGLDFYAEIALRAGDAPRAVRLASAASRMKDELGGGPPSWMLGAEDPLVVGRRTLGDEAFESEADVGRTMTLETAISEALGTRPTNATS
jgi:predicted ATPase/class 3 adenylate cyclase